MFSAIWSKGDFTGFNRLFGTLGKWLYLDKPLFFD
jgi:hypothetical protein